MRNEARAKREAEGVSTFCYSYSPARPPNLTIVSAEACVRLAVRAREDSAIRGGAADAPLYCAIP